MRQNTQVALGCPFLTYFKVSSGRCQDENAVADWQGTGRRKLYGHGRLLSKDH